MIKVTFPTNFFVLESCFGKYFFVSESCFGKYFFVSESCFGKYFFLLESTFQKRFRQVWKRFPNSLAETTFPKNFSCVTWPLVTHVISSSKLGERRAWAHASLISYSSNLDIRHLFRVLIVFRKFFHVVTISCSFHLYLYFVFVSLYTKHKDFMCHGSAITDVSL